MRNGISFHTLAFWPVAASTIKEEMRNITFRKRWHALAKINQEIIDQVYLLNPCIVTSAMENSSKVFLQSIAFSYTFKSPFDLFQKEIHSATFGSRAPFRG